MLKKGIDRNQMQMLSLESLVAQDSVVRVIDAFVNALDLEQLEFIIKGKIKNDYNCILLGERNFKLG